MESYFIKLLNMSISAGLLVLVILLMRLVLKKAPKNVRCIMWALVGIRLMFPFSIQSALSLMPSPETIPVEMIWSDSTGTTAAAGEDTGGQAAAPVISGAISELGEQFSDPMLIITRIGMIIWAAGFLTMIIYAAVSYIQLRRKVSASIKIADDIWMCDDIASPFILGIFKPRIYVPSNIEAGRMTSIAAHERTHISRRDHWWKPLGFILLSVHWFNPLVWLAYVLFCRDIELACDERVIKDMDVAEKQDYSEALLSCSVSRRSIAACPLAFGEVGVKERIKSVLSYKKPTVWILTAAVVVCAVTAVCFLTDPVTTKIDSELEAYLHMVILEEGRSEHTDDRFACEAHDVIGVERNGDIVTVYALVMYNEYSFENGIIKSESGWHIPSVITVDMSGSGYSYEYWIPGDGTRYASSIREKFPWYLAERAIKIHLTADAHTKLCIEQAEAYFGAEYVDPYADMTHTTTAMQAGTAQSNRSAFIGEWKNIKRTDMGLEMTVNEDGTGTVLYTSGDVLDFTWEETDEGDMRIRLLAGNYITFRFRAASENGDALYGSSSYSAVSGFYSTSYLMVEKEKYDDVLKSVEITEDNWTDYFEIVQRAYLTGEGDEHTGRLVNVFRLKDEYAGCCISADVFLTYTQSEPAMFAVEHSNEQVDIFQRRSYSGYSYGIKDETNTTRFVNDNFEIIDGLELAHGGNAIDGTFTYDGETAEWDSILFTSIEIDKINGTLYYAVL